MDFWGLFVFVWVGSTLQHALNVSGTKVLLFVPSLATSDYVAMIGELLSDTASVPRFAAATRCPRCFVPPPFLDHATLQYRSLAAATLPHNAERLQFLPSYCYHACCRDSLLRRSVRASPFRSVLSTSWQCQGLRPPTRTSRGSSTTRWSRGIVACSNSSRAVAPLMLRQSPRP